MAKVRHKQYLLSASNRKKVSKEWEFRFCVSRLGEEQISGEEIGNLMDLIVDLVERKGMYLGGGFKPYIKEIKEKENE